jgi:hypothetical protein
VVIIKTISMVIVVIVDRVVMLLLMLLLMAVLGADHADAVFVFAFSIT